MAKVKTLLVDADSVVYRCGFASEVHSYHIIYAIGDNTPHEIRFSPTKDKSAGDLMKAWVEDMTASIEYFEILDKEKLVAPEPLEFALEATKYQIQSIIDECGAKNVVLYLSGKENYRYALAVQRPYKGNRAAIPKPVHYEDIRRYITREWGATIVDRIEADDRISIEARKPGSYSIIATIDKDLDQIPGRHYNYMKKVWYDVDETEAELFFYQQCLSGDTTDNIPGCYKVGAIKAEKIVNSAYERGGYTKVWNDVILQYTLSKERAGCPYADGDASSVALETARLVRLQTYEGELFVPPGEPKQLVTEALYG